MLRIEGFRWGAVDVGARGRLNVGLLVADSPQTVGAGVYTTSDVVAAPVVVSREHGRRASKRAVIINAGHANAYTGHHGLSDAREVCRSLAAQMKVRPDEIFVASTGVIGARPPVALIKDALPKLLEAASEDGLPDFARAIMTTDTRPKVHESSAQIDEHEVRFAGCSKGAGMIMPNMATMLAVVATDALVEAGALQQALRRANAASFNCITVDGDTSTNDCVLLLASGKSGGPKIEADSDLFEPFSNALADHLTVLAKEIVRDGEGATKFIEIRIRGAVSASAARDVALSIANSPLVKTAFHGEDLNFGRIAMAIGKARTGMNPDKVEIKIGPHIVASGGVIATGESAQAAQAALKESEITLDVDFKQGADQATVWTCDLSAEYIRINADYTT